MSNKLLLIDGNSLSFRAFFALGQSVDAFINNDGLHTNAIYSFNKMLDIILDKVNPTKVLVAFDAGEKTFRNKLYDNYKDGRAKTPNELLEQLPYIEELLDYYGIKTYKIPDYEADDIIGTLARKADAKNYETFVITGDRDLLQLTTEKTTVALTVKGVSQIEEYTPDHVRNKLELDPDQIVDMKGLTGDKSDHYPGVTKVGDKTAIKLLKEYKSLENLYSNIDELKNNKLKEHLIEDQDKAFLSKKLAQINLDSPIEIDLEDLIYKETKPKQLYDFYRQMDFKSYLKKIDLKERDNSNDKYLSPIKYTILDKNNIKEVTDSKHSEIIFYVETILDNYHTAPIVGAVISVDDKFWVTNDIEILKTINFKNWLKDKTINTFDSKKLYVLLNRLEIEPGTFKFDILLQSYLLKNISDNDLGDVAYIHGYENIKTDKSVYGTGRNLDLPEDSMLFNHLVNKAKAINILGAQLNNEIAENDFSELYTNVEQPLSLVLAQMEIIGITIDASHLENMGKIIEINLKNLEQEIYNLAGEEFNINSPKQLGEILFEKLNLPPLKKTKTGFSTAVDVLEKLRHDAPIVDDILKYRMLNKIQSTYIEGLLKSINKKDNKIHTTYIQTLTQTGRLSSINPNLQNIPTRTMEGKELRKAFIPSHQGWKLYRVDYSQIELRVLAHLANDEHLTQSFKNDEDVHTSTAIKILGLKDASEVTADIRRKAKAVNFGVVYGISDYGLSQNIGISRPEAKEFIENYFKQFPSIKKYIDETIKIAKKQGYIETMDHHRRYIPDINNANFTKRSFAERTAVNTPIQGSAADIIKKAMVEIQNEMLKHSLSSKMLLQVHDELVFEVPQNEMEIMEKIVPKVMENIFKLNVPLKVETSWGNNWYDTK